MLKAPCKDCKDRVPEPNCHMTCETYITYRQDKDKEIEDVREYKQNNLRMGSEKYGK